MLPHCRWFLVLCAVLVLAAGCRGATPVGAGAVAAPAPRGDPITIGGTLDLAGAPDVATDVKAAYDLWAERTNDAGGLLGRPVEVRIYDDQGRADAARSLYARLLDQDSVDLLLAPDADQVGEVLPLAERRRMLLFNGDVASSAVRSRWLVDTFTYTEQDYARGVFAMLDDLPPAQRPQRVGIATADDAFMQRVRDGVDGRGGVRRLAEAHGMDVVVDVEHPAAAPAMDLVVRRAQDADVDLFFALSHTDDAATLAQAAERMAFAPAVFCACGAQVAGMPSWHRLGASGDGVVSTAMASPAADHPGLEPLAARVRPDGRTGVPARVAGAYAALQVLADLVERVERLDSAVLRAALPGRTVATAAGRISYGADGVPGYAAIVVQTDAAGDRVVWPPGSATARLALRAD